MITSADIKVGMNLFVVNCSKKTVTASVVTGIYDDNVLDSTVKIDSISDEFKTSDLIRLLNTDTSSDLSFFGIKLMDFKDRYYISLNEKDAYRHLTENVLGAELLHLEVEAENAHSKYIKCVNAVGELERQREALREKYNKL